MKDIVFYVGIGAVAGLLLLLIASPFVYILTQTGWSNQGTIGFILILLVLYLFAPERKKKSPVSRFDKRV